METVYSIEGNVELFFDVFDHNGVDTQWKI